MLNKNLKKTSKFNLKKMLARMGRKRNLYILLVGI